MARNLAQTPIPPPGVEVWAANSPLGYLRRLPRLRETHEWTRWFNLHSRTHMDATYPRGVKYYQKQDGSKPLYTQLYWPDLPGSTVFPRQRIQEAFATSKGPIRYFTSTVNWMVPFAYLEGFRRIEFWGFALVDTKPEDRWIAERACFFYWVQRLRDLGVEITYQPEIEAIPFEPGDPDAYNGPLYGYSTRAEPGWDPTIEQFVGAATLHYDR